MSTNVAVILAGGVGIRVGLGIPKQMIKIAGRTVLEHTLSVFQPARRTSTRSCVMMTPGHVEAVRAVLRPGDYQRSRR